jgi:hypothetical protein
MSGLYVVGERVQLRHSQRAGEPSGAGQNSDSAFYDFRIWRHDLLLSSTE